MPLIITDLPAPLEARWKTEFVKTTTNSSGKRLDMYWLVMGSQGDDCVSFAVPHGRTDIVDFVTDAIRNELKRRRGT